MWNGAFSMFSWGNLGGKEQIHSWHSNETTFLSSQLVCPFIFLNTTRRRKKTRVIQEKKTSRQAAKWTPPDHFCYKLNVDASISSSQKVMGVGAVIIDSEGFLMAALAKKLDGAFSVCQAEAKAISVNLSWAREVGLNL
ncbi:hypothetical protein TIFTF001_025644 [Ficus carica]|uniref:RNase H type-1 domain-containing protein n=1 Tax=Ficus carica TaxID=3494 RepID=A0AA88AX21_FICCA|nr:hypothetical protein TIFTF001_025644 [Ficus carica]